MKSAILCHVCVCVFFATSKTMTKNVALVMVVFFPHDWYLIALVIRSMLLPLEFF
jgi:hypothetical protein